MTTLTSDELNAGGVAYWGVLNEKKLNEDIFSILLTNPNLKLEKVRFCEPGYTSRQSRSLDIRLTLVHLLTFM